MPSGQHTSAPSSQSQDELKKSLLDDGEARSSCGFGVLCRRISFWICPPSLHRYAEKNEYAKLVGTIRKCEDGTEIKRLVNEFDEMRRPPLFYAVKEGNIDVARVLLQNGANPKVLIFSESLKTTLVHMAADKGNNEMAALLIAHGGSDCLQMKDDRGKIPYSDVTKLRAIKQRAEELTRTTVAPN